MQLTAKVIPRMVVESIEIPKAPSLEEHLRQQFESTTRQTDLAFNMPCFQPGGELLTIRYIAYAHGVHVARWLKVLSHTQANVHIETANPIPSFSGDYLSNRPLVPSWLRIPMVVRYFLAGLACRLSRPVTSLAPIHAHCASGNGLVAWMSGQKYLIGTYGSEIYGANERGFAYRWLLKRILRGAERISVCSQEGVKVLREQFGVPIERIYFFHLGFDDQCFCPVSDSVRRTLRQQRQLPLDEPIWVINRRSTPHYRTLEVVQGFLDFCRSGGCGRLIVLSGDHESGYTAKIKEVISAHEHQNQVCVVARMLSPKELADWLRLADFSISVPKTDNMSISILESMGCETIPIVADLEAYRPYQECSSVLTMSEFEPAAFRQMFAATAASHPAERADQGRECSRFAQAGFSTKNAIRDIAAFYLGTPLRESTFVKRAA